jgi:tyrosine-protein kinase Etk/Wzc
MLMNKEFNLITVIRTILKWKLPIVIVTLTAGILSVGFCKLVMDEWFLSWSTFYPVNQYLNDRSMIFNTESSGGQINYYGDKNDVNRCLTIANSTPVIEFVIQKYNLVEHYKIDTNKLYWRTKVRKKFDKNYKAIKTEHEAVEVSFYDTDPKVAADIVNTIVDRVDEINKQRVTENNKKLFDLLNYQIGEQQTKVEGYADTLAILGEKYDVRVEMGQAGSKMVKATNFQAAQLYETILGKQENAMKELNNRINIRDQLEVSLKNSTTSSSLSITDRGFPADRKSKPVTWLVLLTTMLVTGFVMVLGALVIEEVKEIKEQL